MNLEGECSSKYDPHVYKRAPYHYTLGYFSRNTEETKHMP